LGGAAGVMLYAGDRHAATSAAGPRTERGVALGFVMLVCGALLTGRLLLSPSAGMAVPPGGWTRGNDGAPSLVLQRASGWYGSRQNGPHRGAYWVLPPGGGMLVLAVLGWVFARYPDPLRLKRASLA
jgi:hypothetical protein